MGLYKCVLHVLFLRDPNADPKAESTGERWIVLSTPLPLFFVFTWPGRSDPPSGRLCACGCRLSDRCFFGMVSVLSLVVNTQATTTPGGITRSRFTPTTSIKICKWNPLLPRRTATFPISGSGWSIGQSSLPQFQKNTGNLNNCYKNILGLLHRRSPRMFAGM